jgi:type II secretory pathway component GspD/PulD (secretin)/beta-lactamase regulating signal transducer with metallopeptidase domain
MMALENIISQEIVQELGWTLLHFVWQAAAIALLLAILLKLLRKSTAKLRYIIACLSLGLIVLLPIVTMQLVPVSVTHLPAGIEPARPPVALPTGQIGEMPTVKMTEFEEVAEPQSTASIVLWKQRAAGLLEPTLPYIVSGWLLGVFGLSLWHLGGWAQLQRLRKKMVKRVGVSLDTKLNQLAEKLGVQRTVELVESALVQIPTVVGWLRPVILLPASALTGLSSEQLEALLAHELAHIRRCDYLVNMLQTLVEILGFYHPAVWWVSHKIRLERENCCDDLAVSISGDKVRYARALTSMEEIRAGRNELAVAATGGNLFGRIRRLVGKDATDSSRASWIPSVIAVLLIAIVAIPTTVALTTKSDFLQAEPGTNVPLEDEKAESAAKLKRIGLAVAMYADDHNENLPDSLQELKHYMREQDFNWPVDNIEYFGKGKSGQRNGAQIPIAYDEPLLEEAGGTNVLFLDFAVRFLETEEFEKLDIRRAEFLIDARLLLVGENFLQNLSRNADFPDEATGFLRLSPEALKSLDVSKTQSLILDEQNTNSLIADVLAHEDAKVLSAPQVICQEDKTAQIKVLRTETYITGYTEPNRPSEKPQPKFDKVEKGISMSLKPKLTPNENVDMEFELEITQVPDFEERMYKGKYPYKHLTVEKTTQATRYIAKNGQTLLCWGPKMSTQKDGRTEQSDLLILITTDIVGSSEQDKSAQTGELTVAGSGKTASDVIMPPGIMQSRILRPNGDELEAKAQIEDETLAESLQEGETSAGGVPRIPVLAISRTPSAEDKSHVQIDCLVVEVFPDLKTDRETTIMAENFLGKKITLRGSTSATEDLLRKAAEATAPVEDETARDKRVTQAQGQFTTLVDVLESRGYMKILMNPTLEVIDGGTAMVRSDQRVPMYKMTMRSTESDSLETKTKYVDLTDSLEITPNILEDGNIILQVEATISSKSTPRGKTPLIDIREISTRARVSDGESLIIGGMKKTEKGAEADSNAKDSQKQTTEMLLILTPTIVNTATVPEKKVDVNVEAKSAEPAQRFKALGKALFVYANDHDDKYPDSLRQLREGLSEEDLKWLEAHVEYLAKGKTIADRPDIATAYDKTLLAEGKGTNVLFNDSHVSFEKPDRLKELGIPRAAIQIETRILTVSEDFLRDIGLDANSVYDSDVWSEHLIAESAAEPNSQTYSIMLDNLNVSFLLRATQAHKGAKTLAAPRVLVWDGEKATIVISNEIDYISGYTEPNRPSGEPVPKHDSVDEGTFLTVKPELTPDSENIHLDFELEIRQLRGVEERKYKGKYPYQIPLLEVASTQTRCAVPDGKTLLIGGQKITREITDKSSVPTLSDLPIIGVLFYRSAKTEEPRTLLILVKPTIQAQQEVEAIRPEKVDSEAVEDPLGRQLEYMLGSSVIPSHNTQ